MEKNGELVFEEYIKAEKYQLSLSLGECRLDPVPVVKGNRGGVYKARLNGQPVALKFIFLEIDSQNGCTSNYFRKEYTNVSLMEYRKSQMHYMDFDLLKIQGFEVPVLVMKPCKSTLADCRSALSPGAFVKLFHFLTSTVRHLTEQKLQHRVISPDTILVDADNEFVLSDLAVPDPLLPADVELQKESDQDELMREFSLICRKNFPKELPEFVHCTDQRRINKLIADFVAHNDFENGLDNSDYLFRSFSDLEGIIGSFLLTLANIHTSLLLCLSEASSQATANGGNEVAKQRQS